MYRILIVCLELIVFILIVFQIIYPLFAGKKLFYSFRKKSKEDEIKSFKDEIEILEKSIELNELERDTLAKEIKEKYDSISKLKEKITNKNN